MKVSEPVMKVLSGLQVNGDRVVIAAQLDRALYTKVNEVLVALGGVWKRQVKAHVFAKADAQERIDATIIAGEVMTAKDLGFFPTSDDLADELVEMAGVGPGHLCLEPSAGTGAIVRAMLTAQPRAIVVIERDFDRRRGLTKLDTESPIPIPLIVMSDVSDFMAFQPDDGTGFDRIVMNPPFYRVGDGDHLDHVRHAFGMLASGGVLVSVLPGGVKFREDRRHVDFRTWVKEYGTMEDLPDGSFKASGTMVRTVVVRMSKS